VAAKDRKFDLTVIGSGPGGYVAAVRAGQLGLSTAVVEMAPRPGGTCLHWGCIPTKAMLHTAEVLESARHASAFGVAVDAPSLDMDGMHEYKSGTVDANTKGVEYLFKKNKVTLLAGRGRLAGEGRVEVTPQDGSPYTVETTHTILATGSTIRGLPGVDFDGERVISSDHALNLKRVPASMIVLGAGAVGVEFASIYRSFGAEVTVVELLPSLVPIEDADLGKELARSFKKRGIGVHTGTRVEKVTAGKKSVAVVADKDGKKVELEAETLLVAIGRAPLTADLGLEKRGVKLDERGFVEVDAMMRTAAAGVYAIGDLVATPALAHVASHEGVVAVEHAAGADPVPLNYDRVPSCTYCTPEVASIGLSEEEAKRRGHDVKVGRFPFSAVAKAKILREPAGFVKIVAEKKYDEVLGIHVIGPHATELIAEGTAALELEATAESLVHAIHAHPTLAEAMGEAALGVHDRSLHI
jgi:dihydrolipoamide dehydrogenase